MKTTVTTDDINKWQAGHRNITIIKPMAFGHTLHVTRPVWNRLTLALANARNAGKKSVIVHIEKDIAGVLWAARIEQMK